jgi:hypothetical protein
LRYSDYVITRDDFPSVCPCEHYWIPSAALRRTRQRCAEALGTIVAIFSNIFDTTVGVILLYMCLLTRGTHTSRVFLERKDGCITNFLLYFLDTLQLPNSQPFRLFSPHPHAPTFCRPLLYNNLLHPFTFCPSPSSQQANPFLSPASPASLLSISVGVAQHGLVVGGLGLCSTVLAFGVYFLLLFWMGGAAARAL